MEETLTTHRGGCHCGRVRFEVQAPSVLEVSSCNCSMCSKTGYLHLLVRAEQFKLTSGEDVITTYEWNTRTAKHKFCSVCGIKAFYIPRSHPDGFSVNARCLDEGTFALRVVRETNGREWEKVYPSGRGTY